SISRPTSAMVARVPSADFWAHSDPEPVTVTGVPAASPCSAIAEAASARYGAAVRSTIGPGPATSDVQSILPRPSAETSLEPGAIPANAGTAVASATPGTHSNGT